MTRLVLDAWAIMAWLKGQLPAAKLVRALLEEAARRERKLVMNVVNVGEVLYLSAKAKDLAYGQRVLDSLRPLIMTASASDELVMFAASLKARHTMSYADAFAVATAISLDVPLVTGDVELRAVGASEQALKLHWIGL